MTPVPATDAGPQPLASTQVIVTDRQAAWAKLTATLEAHGLSLKLSDERTGLVMAEQIRRYGGRPDRFSAEGMRSSGRVGDWATCPKPKHPSYIVSGTSTVLTASVSPEPAGYRVTINVTYTEQRALPKGLGSWEFQDAPCETTGILESEVAAALAK